MPIVPKLIPPPLRKPIPLLVIIALLAVVVLGVANSGFGTVFQTASPNTCNLPTPAFCDTFTTASPGGRGGGLDETRWSVTRQLAGNAWGPSTLPICDQNLGAIVPDSDVNVCPADATGSYFDEQFDDHGTFVRMSFRPRQAFDFAGRTGTITMDVDAKTEGGHSYWVEVWIADQPQPAVGNGPGVATQPRNGIGLEFSGCAAETPGGNVATVQYIDLARNYAWTQLHYGNDFSSPNCVTTADGQRNHFEIRLSQNHVEVWGTDKGPSGPLKQLAVKDGINLPFTRGYVSYAHTHYNAAKQGASPDQHYEWASMGFDGPVLPAARGYDVPDALTPHADGSVTLSYALSGGAHPGSPAFVLHAIDLTGATDASLNLDVESNFSTASGLQYRLNGGPWRNVASPFPDVQGDWRAVSVPISLADLKNGDNTLELAAATGLDVQNIDVTVNTSVSVPPATSPPTSVPTATIAPIATATAASVATATAVPSTPVPTSVPLTPTPGATPVDCQVQVTVSQHAYTVQPGPGCQ